MPVKNDSNKNRYLYVLELENNCFYVGQTSSSIKKRLTKHFNGKGSAWTKKNPPIRLVDLVYLGNLTYTEGEYMENKYVCKYMKEYGWDKVRGGYFTLSDNNGHWITIKNHKKKNVVRGIKDVIIPDRVQD